MPFGQHAVVNFYKSVDEYYNPWDLDHETIEAEHHRHIVMKTRHLLKEYSERHLLKTYVTIDL
jgi:hypothetical protein